MARRNRIGRIVVPEDVVVPDQVVVDELPGDFPDAHDWYGEGIHSWMKGTRAHHRIHIDDQVARYVAREVRIQESRKAFNPFLSHWYRDRDGYTIVNHREPSAMVEKWANQKMRDWKHHARNERDFSRAEAFRLIDYRRPGVAKFLYGAFGTDNIPIILDTALTLVQMQR